MLIVYQSIGSVCQILPDKFEDMIHYCIERISTENYTRQISLPKKGHGQKMDNIVND
ncbi:hypothetical protein [Emticicia sp. 17c]|uniref:hypothetical protein n=1 Tax=Emticicia sp. 17c TaxID=3127704 RepID=UPI00301C9FB0